MKKTILSVLLALMMLVVFNFVAVAQAQWKVGDKVEIPNLSKEWKPGTIIGVLNEGGTLYYRVQLDDPNSQNVYFNHTLPSDVRAREGQTPKKPADDLPDTVRPAMPVGAFAVGDQVDTFYDLNRGHNRGTIIETGNRRYKVHYTGCTKTWDEWVDSSLVQAPATISPNAPEIKYLFGKWRLTEVAVGGNFVAWGKAPGLQINADGTYIWFQGAGAAPIKGKWITDAKVPKLNEGTPKFDGVIVKDEVGQEWKAFHWIVKGDTKDHIEIDRMCLGLSQVGSRF